MSGRAVLVIALAVMGLLLVIVLTTLLGDVDDATEIRGEQVVELEQEPDAGMRESFAQADDLAAAVTTTSTSTTEQARSAPTASRSLSSTMYCEQGHMANGALVHDGAVSSKVLPRGSSWLVLDGPEAGRVFTVEDTGSAAYFDMWTDSCADALRYGRHQIEVAPA